MANSYLEDIPFPRMRRVTQINDYFCGPAVIRMLLSFWGVRILQRDIVTLAGFNKRRMRYHGLSLAEMARAVDIVAPNLQFWSKQKMTFSELDKLINKYKIPTGVEWQGIFEEYSSLEDDDGHYSVVTFIDLPNNIIKLADPFGPFSEEDRVFSIKRFDGRWWDENQIETENATFTEYDENLAFIVVPKEDNFPEEIGMIKGLDRGERY